MQLFEVEVAKDVVVKAEIKHQLFKDWQIDGRSGRESDIEEVLIRHPAILNYGAFEPSSATNVEVLIVAQQPTTSNRKRADLFGIHRDGSLVVIEIKRDAVDEKNRTEGLEFQAIRYAAASRKLTLEAIIDMFSGFLRKRNTGSAPQDAGDAYWRSRAVSLLSAHLADEDEELSEADLTTLINPKVKQKIYLVAADYEGDVTAACAWLRQHDIDISAFRLRPYTVENKKILERERLIPPPELDDFMEAEGSDPSNLPMRTSSGTQGHFSSPVDVGNGLFVDLHGSANAIQGWVDKILKGWGKEVTLTVETENGESFDFPRDQASTPVATDATGT